MLAGLLLAACAPKESEEITLKEVFGDKFLIGAAINVNQSSERDSAGVAIIKKHFNSIVAENCMKCAELRPAEGEFFFDEADRFIRFGQENNMTIIGHCLIWHSQCAPWFWYDDKGELVSADVLKARMKEHIHTVVGRYKGKVHGWDVVNEAIVEDGSYRNSPFYQILGEEFIPLAFQYAHEADPDAELYLNDYGMNVPGRRDTYVKIINDLKQRGLRIDAIGMQGHMGMDYPSMEQFKASFDAFAATGIKVMITEWDMSALPTVHHSANVGDRAEFEKAMNPYPEALPDSVSKVWNARMKMFMDFFIENADVLERVTAWGVSDGDSWKNDFPMKGRREYPLLFDRNYEMKDFLKEYIEDYKKTKK